MFKYLNSLITSPEIVKRLYGLTIESNCENDNEDNDLNWSIVKHLVKMLIKNGDIKQFEDILIRKNCDSKCVTVGKTQDGRIQFGVFKEYPHLVTCRLWRWPELKTRNQVKHMSKCDNNRCNNPSSQEICINPYHYMRTDTVESERSFTNSQTESSSASSSSFQTDDMVIDGLNEDFRFMIPLSSPLISEDGDANSEENVDTYNEFVNKFDHTELNYWCSIAYYEKKDRFGETFHASSLMDSLIIDGFMDAHSINRFCLGILTNMNRDRNVELTRRCIGHGIELKRNGTQIVLECLSQNPVFVQSAVGNLVNNWAVETVCKVMNRCQLPIFDLNMFLKILYENRNECFEKIYTLKRLCTIRVSFVKGWGCQYTRPSILDTPCWIEIHLNGPLKYVDTILRQKGTPEGACDSKT